MCEEMRSDIPCCDGELISMYMHCEYIQPLPLFGLERRFVGNFRKGHSELARV